MAKQANTKRQAELNQAGPEHSVQQSRARKGKDKVAAGQGPEKGLGDLIVRHLREAGTNVRHDLITLASKDTATIHQAIDEVDKAKKDEQQGVKDEYIKKGADGKPLTLHPTAKAEMDKKIASISANYSRVLGIMRAMASGFNVKNIVAARNLNEMYALSRSLTPKKPAEGQITSDGFKGLEERVKRVVVPKADGSVSGDALARLEALFNATVAELSKYSTITSIPVQQILALTAKGKGGAKHLKAA